MAKRTSLSGERKYDLEDRLVAFTCRMIDVVEALPNSRAGNYIAGQLIRSCHSPAFNYGEVQAAESRNDFIHKLRICLKEFKECRTAEDYHKESNDQAGNQVDRNLWGN